jgi:hypothetical protein
MYRTQDELLWSIGNEGGLWYYSKKIGFQMFKKFAFLVFLVNFLSASNAQEIDLNTLKMADGFSINIYAHVKNPRQMTLGENGTVYVGTRSGAQGSVFALLNPDGSDMTTDILTVDKGLRSPNGVTFKDGDLYVAAMTTVSRQTVSRQTKLD